MLGETWTPEALKQLNDCFEGHSPEEILHWDQPTVKFHINSILSELGMTSRTEAVVLSVRHHLVR